MTEKEKDMTSSSSPPEGETATGQWASTSAGEHPSGRHVGDNVLRLVAWREISPRVKRPLKKLWGETARWTVSSCRSRYELVDAKHGLIQWTEAESLRHCSAKYCTLVPPPRSTIAAAFSPDGHRLASTHGDHTVKIICFQTGGCIKVLSGHRRTPWVVRFHPFRQEILASGSLDHQVRLWDANTAECIGSRDFNRPIASIAFHAHGDLLAVASGHKLYIWRHSAKGDASAPMIVLRTRRSLRAVHFHPHAAPILLTAEVNDLDAPDSPMTVATSHGYLRYPPPDVFFTPVNIGRDSSIPISTPSLGPLMPFPRLLWPHATVGSNNMTLSQSDGLRVNSNARESEAENTETLQLVRELDLQARGTPMEVPENANTSISTGESLSESVNHSRPSENMANSRQHNEPENSVYESGVDMLLRAAERHMRDYQRDSLSISEVSNQNVTLNRAEPGHEELGESSISRSPSSQEGQMIRSSHILWPLNISQNVNVQLLLGGRQLNQFLPLGDQPGWEFSFLQGWVMGQTQAGLHPVLPTTGPTHMQTIPSDVRITVADQLQQNATVSLASATLAAGMPTDRIHGRSAGRHRSRSRLNSQAGGGVGLHIGTEGAQPILSTAEAAAAHEAFAATAAAAELPCTVKLRIWPYDIKNPCASLDSKTCRLTIPHAVLCSEMGAHFSPCGRFLAACVACVLPSQESDVGLLSQSNFGPGGTATSPTRHPISAQQVVYELRIYSLEEATFGEVLASRAIRAAHCLTSIQFSPTSAHILLAYGRRHNSLLRSIVVDGTDTVPIYTILEIYRVSDMKLVRVLPSAEDEVNVACFHPLVGGGLVYGTKEGKLRIINNSSLHAENGTGYEENVFEEG
ncbi:uncharacterized protein LOC131067847 isoform X1 [Cryptomeria japonica]|uniref:uncharacterized protein LOC131067847 isoform X1 n=2 Tax=Cryptomeria japonica TaxID=3369 RepID=UPI0027DAA5E5|nr:uncharacterized protein LOC131067847 isoform X1 [Cryptomeria japonica]